MLETGRPLIEDGRSNISLSEPRDESPRRAPPGHLYLLCWGHPTLTHGGLSAISRSRTQNAFGAGGRKGYAHPRLGTVKPRGG